MKNNVMKKISILGFMFLNFMTFVNAMDHNIRNQHNQAIKTINNDALSIKKCAKFCTAFGWFAYTVGHTMTRATDNNKWFRLGVLASISSFAICGGYVIKKFVEFPEPNPLETVKRYCAFQALSSSYEHLTSCFNRRLYDAEIRSINNQMNLANNGMDAVKELFKHYCTCAYAGGREGFWVASYAMGIPLIVYASTITIKEWFEKK